MLQVDLITITKYWWLLLATDWLGDALFWFIEFLFEISSSDHFTQLFTQHLISYPFLKVAMLTTPRKDHSAKILHPSPETVKVFKMSDKKFYNWTGQTTYFAERGRRLGSTNSISKCFETITSKHQRDHLQLWPLIGQPRTNPGLSLAIETSSSFISGNIPNCLLGQFESWNGTGPSKSNFLFNWAES